LGKKATTGAWVRIRTGVRAEIESVGTGTNSGLHLPRRAGAETLQPGLRRENPDWEVVEALNEMGVRAGDRVGYLGDTLGDHGWAYLGNLSIAAEIPEEDQPTYWAATNNEKQQVNSWIAKTGAKVIVTRNVPLSGPSAGWKRVGTSDYYILEIP
jgi:hypothetical protein